jgi:hypothetical protein
MQIYFKPTIAEKNEDVSQALIETLLKKIKKRSAHPFSPGFFTKLIS